MGSQQLENLIGALCLSVTDAVAQGIERADGAYGTATFALVLLQHGGTLRLDKLSRQLGLAQSSTVRLVARLERAGLVSRAKGEDKRVALLTLTPAGISNVARILAARQDVLREILGQLSPEEQQLLGKITMKLLDTLTPSALAGERNCRLCDEAACDLSTCPVDRRYQTFPDAYQPD